MKTLSQHLERFTITTTQPMTKIVHDLLNSIRDFAVTKAGSEEAFAWRRSINGVCLDDETGVRVSCINGDISSKYDWLMLAMNTVLDRLDREQLIAETAVISVDSLIEDADGYVTVTFSRAAPQPKPLPIPTEPTVFNSHDEQCTRFLYAMVEFLDERANCEGVKYEDLMEHNNPISTTKLIQTLKAEQRGNGVYPTAARCADLLREVASHGRNPLAKHPEIECTIGNNGAVLWRWYKKPEWAVHA